MASQQYRASDRQHGCADCPGSILVAKANHFRFRQGNIYDTVSRFEYTTYFIKI